MDNCSKFQHVDVLSWMHPSMFEHVVHFSTICGSVLFETSATRSMNCMSGQAAWRTRWTGASFSTAI